MAEPEPEGTRRRRRLGRETRAAPLARDDCSEHARAAAGGDHARDPRCGREARRRDLALHAAAAERGRCAQLDLVRLLALGEQPGAGGRRMRRVHALSLGEKDQQPRAEQHRHLRGQRVVVAERDLVGGRRVVLVHDRDGGGAQ
jgi:hypothetical protein